MVGIAADIVKIRAKIGQVIVEGKRLRLAPVNFPEFRPFVKRYFGLGRFQFKTGVPCAALWTVEPAAAGTGVGESGIYDAGVVDAENEFVNADAREQIGFAQESVIRGAFEFEQSLQLAFVVAKNRQDTFIAVTGWDQTMSIILTNRSKLGRHCPPRRASSNWRTRTNAGMPPLIM